MSTDRAAVVRFGAFEVDPVTAELRRSGRRVHVPPQAARLLLLLTSRPGELVTREEIRSALWPDDTFVDFDAAMNACISQIRAALGDKPTAPRFIETLPRRGYRFLAPLTAAAVATETSPSVEERAPAIEPAPAQTRSRAVAGWGFAAACVAAATLLSTTDHSGWDPMAFARGRSLEALQKLERGRSGLADAAPDELVDRVRHLERAIALEPEFAAPYAALADVKLLLATYRREPAAMAYAAAKAAAAKAIALDSRSGDAHATYAAATLMFEWDWAAARRHFARAEMLAPRSTRVHHWYSRYLTAIGSHDDAVRHARRAAQLDPTSPSAVTYLGVAAYYAGDTKEARTQCTRARGLMVEFQPAELCLTALDDASGAHSPAYPEAYLAPVLQQARQGDHTGAFASLQRAANRRSDVLVFARVQPALRSLALEPEFERLLDRVGLPARTTASR